MQTKRIFWFRFITVVCLALAFCGTFAFTASARDRELRAPRVDSIRRFELRQSPRERDGRERLTRVDRTDRI
jgi:hypothetical protein